MTVTFRVTFRTLKHQYQPTGAEFPIRGLLTIDSGTAGTAETDVAIVMDNSASMRFGPEHDGLTPDGITRYEAVRQVLPLLWNKVTGNTHVGLVAFGSMADAQVVIPLNETMTADTARAAISNLKSGGMTEPEFALPLALEMLEKGRKGAAKLIWFITDGDFDVSQIESIVTAYQERGIKFLWGSVGKDPKFATLSSLHGQDPSPMHEIFGMARKADLARAVTWIAETAGSAWGRDLELSFELAVQDSNADVNDVWATSPRLVQTELKPLDGNRMMVDFKGPLSGNPGLFFFGTMEAPSEPGKVAFLRHGVARWQTSTGPKEIPFGDVLVEFGSDDAVNDDVKKTQQLLAGKRGIVKALKLAAKGNMQGSLALLDSAEGSLVLAGVNPGDLLGDLRSQIQSGTINATTGGQSLAIADDAIGDLM